MNDVPQGERLMMARQRYETVKEEERDPLRRLAALAARVTGAEIGILSLLRADDKWWHVAYGIRGADLPQEIGFCREVLTNGSFLYRADTEQPPQRDQTFFRGSNLRFGAGVPLVAPDGFVVGTLCALDMRLSHPEPSELKDLLSRLAAIAMDEIELSRSFRAAYQSRLQMRELISNVPEGIMFFDASGRLAAWNAAMEKVAPRLMPMLSVGRDFDEIETMGRERLLGNPPKFLISADIGEIEQFEGRTFDGRFIRVRIRKLPAGERFVFCSDVSDLRKRETKLRQTEAVIKKAEELAKMGYFVFDTSRFVTEFISPGIFKIADSLNSRDPHLGYEDMLARVHPDDLEKVKTSTLSSIERNEPLNVEFRALTESGEIQHLWLTDATVEDAETGRELRVGVVQDLTDRREKEVALEEAVAFKRAISDAALDCIVVADSEGKIIDFNPSAERTFGFKADEVIGKPLSETIIPQEYRKAHQAGLERYRETGVGKVVGNRIEIEALHADGTVFPVELSIAPVEVEGVGYFAAYLRDISDRIRAKSELERNENILATAMDLAHLGSFEWEVATNHVVWSDQTFRIIGLEKTEGRISFETYWELVHPDDREMVRRVIDNAVERREDYDVEHRLIRPDGKVRIIAGRGRVQVASGGRAERVVGTIQDVTAERQHEVELKGAKEAAESANSAKSEFLATISHEIRTPLNGVLGTLNLLEDTTLGSEQRRYSSIARASGEILLTLINDILDWSKIEAGELRLEMSLLDPRSIAVGVTELVRPDLDKKGLLYEVNVSPDLPEGVVSDESRIRQILLNLVSNAVKFTDRGSVQVRLGWDGEQGSPDGMLLIDVIDTGIGIPQNQIPRLFERFTQVESARKRRHGGTGLGLAICHQLVEMLGGTISVESEVDSGSHFHVRLPMKKGTVPPRDKGAAPEREVKELSGRILLVEDNQTNALVATAVLRKKGARVDHVMNGLEALEALRDRPYDLVLMDVSMPEMDGMEATRKIRSGEAGSTTIPILAMTAYASSQRVKECLQVGMNDYVRKPFDKDRFIRTVARWLEPNGQTEEISTVSDADGERQPLLMKEVESGIWNDVPREVTREIVQHYLGELREAMNSMRDMDSLDNQHLSQIAHTLASSSANVGAMHLASLARKIEEDSLTGGNRTVTADLFSDAANQTIVAIKRAIDADEVPEQQQ